MAIMMIMKIMFRKYSSDPVERRKSGYNEQNGSKETNGEEIKARGDCVTYMKTDTNHMVAPWANAMSRARYNKACRNNRTNKARRLNLTIGKEIQREFDGDHV